MQNINKIKGSKTMKKDMRKILKYVWNIIEKIITYFVIKMID
jgi:hypothetical protein